MDAGERLPGVVRLHYVVVGPEVEAVDAGAHIGAGGDHDHRGAGALADLAADLVAVLVGQAEVEEDDTEAVALGDECLEGLLAAAGVRDVESVPRQDRGQSGGDMVVVLDEEQSHPGPLRFIVRMVSACTKARLTHACTQAVTLMDEDAVKWVPVACGLPLSSRYGSRRQSATTRVLLLSDRDAQISLRCDDAGRKASLLSSATDEDGASKR